MSTGPTHLEVDLNYTANTGVRPVSYTFTPPPGVPQRSDKIQEQRVRVQNARLQPEQPALDRNDFLSWSGMPLRCTTSATKRRSGSAIILGLTRKAAIVAR